MAAGDVADGVAARLATREPDRCEEAQHLAALLELHEVELHVLARGEVRPAARVRLRDVAEHLQLVGFDAAVRDLHPHHLVEATLPLPVDALVQSEDAEDVIVDLARDEPPGAVLEPTELFFDLGIEREGPQFAYIDRHSRRSYSGIA